MRISRLQPHVTSEAFTLDCLPCFHYSPHDASEDSDNGEVVHHGFKMNFTEQPECLAEVCD